MAVAVTVAVTVAVAVTVTVAVAMMVAVTVAVTMAMAVVMTVTVTVAVAVTVVMTVAASVAMIVAVAVAVAVMVAVTVALTVAVIVTVAVAGAGERRVACSPWHCGCSLLRTPVCTLLRDSIAVRLLTTSRAHAPVIVTGPRATPFVSGQSGPSWGPSCPRVHGTEHLRRHACFLGEGRTFRAYPDLSCQETRLLSPGSPAESGLEGRCASPSATQRQRCPRQVSPVPWSPPRHLPSAQRALSPSQGRAGDV